MKAVLRLTVVRLEGTPGLVGFLCDYDGNRNILISCKAIRGKDYFKSLTRTGGGFNLLVLRAAHNSKP